MTDNLGVVDAKINQEDFTLSVAQHVLGLSDEFLGLTGAAADAERTLRFRRWWRRTRSPARTANPSCVSTSPRRWWTTASSPT
ncbi:MAG: hypothetical protein R2838_08740 [Caldilineaceae bacterium]